MVEKYNNNSLVKIWQCLVCVLLFLMIWATGHVIKIKILLVLICIAVGFLKNNFSIKFEKWSSVWTITYLLFNIIYLAYSYFSGNSSVLSLISIRVIEPVIFLVLLSLISFEDYSFIKRILFFITLFVFIYSIISFLSVNNLIPINYAYLPFVKIDFGGVLPFGLRKATSENNQWFYYLIPCCVATCINEEESVQVLNKKLKIINLFLAVIVTIITLKTALIIVFITSIFLSLVLNCIKRKISKVQAKRYIVCIVLLICFMTLLFVPMIRSFLLDTLLEKVRISLGLGEVQANQYGVVDSGADIRIQQISDLLSAWKERPLFGWGDGSNSHNVIRSNTTGFYEMVYFAKLMQRGIVGAIIYICLFSSIYFRMLKIFKDNTCLSSDSYVVIISFSCMLIANATNPYIEAFDKLVIIFIPILLIKLYNFNEFNDFACNESKRLLQKKVLGEINS